MTGLEHIAQAFAAARSNGRAALIPYFTVGYPDLATSQAVVEAVSASGADLIELGLPFSDPLADGPTIQRSTQVALENGVTLHVCLDFVRRIRKKGVIQPLLLMGYYNPILAYGVDIFAVDAAKAGADGLVVPDLPPEEAEALSSACRQNGLALVYLVAPTTPDERLRRVATQSSGFLYIVSLTGVTGARRGLQNELQALIQRARSATDKPLAVGFGISTPGQATRVGQLADGVIVGSALIDAVSNSETPAIAAGNFVASLRLALGGK